MKMVPQYWQRLEASRTSPVSESQHLFEYDVQEEELREHFGSLINFVKTRAGLLLTHSLEYI